jgi:hypothetical protein
MFARVIPLSSHCWLTRDHMYLCDRLKLNGKELLPPFQSIISSLLYRYSKLWLHRLLCLPNAFRSSFSLPEFTFAGISFSLPEVISSGASFPFSDFIAIGISLLVPPFVTLKMIAFPFFSRGNCPGHQCFHCRYFFIHSLRLPSSIPLISFPQMSQFSVTSFAKHRSSRDYQHR